MLALAMNEFFTVLGAVLPVFSIMGAGFLLRRLDWLTEEADQSLMRVTINGLIPCLIIDSVISNVALRQPRTVVLAPLVGFVTVVAGIGLGWLSRRLVGIREPAAGRTFAYCLGIYNYCYVPLPLAILLFTHRPETVGVLFVHNVGVEIAFWTLGLMLLSGASARQGWKKAINAPVISILAGLALNYTRGSDWVPAFVLTAAHVLGQCAFPMGLLLIGAVVSDELSRFRSASGWRVMAGACLLRLGLLPLLFLLLARHLPCSPELKSVIVLQAAMPAAVFPIVVSKHYGGDINTALRVVLGTSVLGLVTIPFWIRFGIKFAGL
ncbi:MAG: AEC family transporter [Verrucomicrobia bacterium]|nr:AEC family transporter [Verrucomicrobiota bacterium]